MGLGIVIPILNEAEEMPSLLTHVAGWRARGNQVVFVDGGSTDGSADLAREQGFAVVSSARGRAYQMNAGANALCTSALLFLHADTRLPEFADEWVLKQLEGGAEWGRFDLWIEGRSPMFSLISTMINLRSRLSGIATGDQALFFRRELFERIGGFPEQPLMEDIEICKRLKRICRPLCLRAKVRTSGRRWERRGVWRTIWLMWRLRWAYMRGASAESLAEAYR